MAYDFPNTPTTGQIVTLGSAQWQWDGVKWASLPGPVLSAQRNLIHNPYFNIQQRGTGPWTATNAYTVDRWQMYPTVGDTGSVSIVSLADTDRAQIGDEAATYASSYTFTGSSTAGSYSLFYQKIETVRRLSGKTITVSAWMRATSGTPRVGVGYYIYYGAGGSPSGPVGINLGVTPALSTTWQRYSITGPLPSSSGKTFGTTFGTDMTQIELWLSDQGTGRGGGIGVQSGTVQFWGVQCEVGNAATPLEKIDPRFDMANCQRFYLAVPSYVIVAGYNGAGALIYGTVVTYPVTMRAAPTLTINNANYSNASTLASNNISPQTLTLQATVGGTTGAAWAYCNPTLSAEP